MAMSFAELSTIRQRQVLEGNVQALETARQREERTRLRKKMNREGARFVAGAGVVVACLFIALAIVKLFSIPIAGPGGLSQSLYSVWRLAVSVRSRTNICVRTSSHGGTKQPQWEWPFRSSGPYKELDDPIQPELPRPRIDV